MTGRYRLGTVLHEVFGQGKGLFEQAQVECADFVGGGGSRQLTLNDQLTAPALQVVHVDPM